MSTVENTKWYICRICLKDEHKKLYNIFECIADEEITDLGTLPDKIELCGGIKLYQQHNLPTKICNRCLLLLRAAYKFRDLCQQSQNQLKQFINLQKPEAEDQNDFNLDSDADEQEAEVQEEVENVILATTHTDEDGYMVEERVDFEAVNDAQYIENNEEEIVSAVEQNEQLEGFSDEDDPQYVVEEVNAKQFVCENNEEESTTYKYEEGIHNDNIIIEEHPGKPERRRIYIKKNKDEEKPVTKRKRKNSEETNLQSSYNCPYCDNTYTDKTKYKMHIKIHKKEKPHECEICNKRFSTTPQLSRHMNSHTGNRPYKCKFCEARFGDPSTKIKHERIHTNERPYKCNMCDKAFAYSNVLKVHKMTHTGEKPHTCDYCGKSFSQVHHKNAHEKRHANVDTVLFANSSDADYIEEEDAEEIKDYIVEEINQQ